MAGRRGVAVAAGVLLVAAVVVGWFVIDARQGGVASTTEYTSDRGIAVSVETPEEDAAVSSPLDVRGRVTGAWSFEADFPVDVLDADRLTVAEGFVTVQGEWMTEEVVDFAGQIEFDLPRTTTGFLVLHRANPSGLRENDDTVEIPIRFRR